jgi:hypothetical protein
MYPRDLQHGDVLLYEKGSKHGTLLGRLIRLITGSRFTHTAIVLQNCNHERFVVEQSGVVSVTNVSNYKFTQPTKITVWRNDSLWLTQDAMHMAWRMTGVKYGVANLFEIMLQHLLGRVLKGWRWNPVFLPPDRLKCTCSGLVAKILVAGIRPLEKSRHFAKTTIVEPDDFNELRGFRQIGVMSDGND